MKRYLLNGWTIMSQKVLPLEERDAIQTPDKTVFLFEAPLNATKMIQHIPFSFLNGDVIEHLEVFMRTSEGDDTVLAVNKTLFFHRYPQATYATLIDFLDAKRRESQRKKHITLLGLGDVGSMLAIGLKLLGGDCVASIGIFDLSVQQKKRWEMELSQITVNPDIKIYGIEQEDLFNGDVFIFCASKAIPKVGEENQSTGDPVDVRMIQFEENAKIISLYAKMARDKNYQGIFAVVSDPVDLLCKAVYTASNAYDGKFDYIGLLPEQVIGFGLGVMDGRAKYYSEQMGLTYKDTGRVFGPHGKDLVVSDIIDAENDYSAETLTHKVITGNLEMRALGYKPYIAPALSSGAHAIVNMLKGEWHYSAQFLGGVYWGARNVRTEMGVQYEYLNLSESLKERLRTSYKKLEDTWETLTS